MPEAPCLRRICRCFRGRLKPPGSRSEADLQLPLSHHVFRGDVACGAVQANVVVVIHVFAYGCPSPLAPPWNRPHAGHRFLKSQSPHPAITYKDRIFDSSSRPRYPHLRRLELCVQTNKKTPRAGTAQNPAALSPPRASTGRPLILIKHGIGSRALLIPGESQADLDAHFGAYRDRFNPADPWSSLASITSLTSRHPQFCPCPAAVRLRAPRFRQEERPRTPSRSAGVG